jgi:hypothetical protein
VLRRMSSTDETRSSCRRYCALSIIAEQQAASATIRGSEARAAHRMGARKPRAARMSRLPTTWLCDIVARSRNGTRLTAPPTAPARLPGIIVIHTNGTVP